MIIRVETALSPSERPTWSVSRAGAGHVSVVLERADGEDRRRLLVATMGQREALLLAAALIDAAARGCDAGEIDG